MCPYTLTWRSLQEAEFSEQGGIAHESQSLQHGYDDARIGVRELRASELDPAHGSYADGDGEIYKIGAEP